MSVMMSVMMSVIMSVMMSVIRTPVIKKSVIRREGHVR